MEILLEAPLQLLVTYIALTLIIQLRYFLIVGPLHWMLWNSKFYFKNAIKLSKVPPNPKTIKHEIKLSLISSFIYISICVFVKLRLISVILYYIRKKFNFWQCFVQSYFWYSLLNCIILKWYYPTIKIFTKRVSKSTEWY